MKRKVWATLVSLTLLLTMLGSVFTLPVSGEIIVTKVQDGWSYHSSGTLYRYNDSYGGGDITVPSYLTNYGYNVYITNIRTIAFYDCDLVTSVTFNNYVTSVETGAFAGCDNLQWINIAYASSVEVPLVSESYDCPKLTAIIANANNRYYTSIDGVLFNKNKDTLVQFPAGRAGAYTIPDSVTTIGNSAFASCKKLTSVTTGNQVTTIEPRTFYNCNSLKSVTIGNNVTTIEYGAFDYCKQIKDVYYVGTEEQAKAITVDDQIISNAVWHYNTCSNDHNYDNTCDTTCNFCEYVREIEHTYDDICDSLCNVCGNERTAPHDFAPATCTEPKTCRICGATTGTALGHDYAPATCRVPKTCTACDATDGDPLPHTYTADCDDVCNVCSRGRSDAIPHTYNNNCDTTCNVCNYVRNVGPHVYDNVLDSTCNECGAEREVHTWDCPVCSGVGDVEGAICQRCDGVGQVDRHLVQYGNKTAEIKDNEIFTVPYYYEDYFQGWALSPYGEIAYDEGDHITVTSDWTLYPICAITTRKEVCSTCLGDQKYHELVSWSCTTCYGSGTQTICYSCRRSTSPHTYDYVDDMGKTHYVTKCSGCSAIWSPVTITCSGCNGEISGSYWETYTCYSCNDGYEYYPTKDEHPQMEAPTILLIQGNTVTLKADVDAEYRVDNEFWQDSAVFTNLSCGTHTFYQRYKETSYAYAGDNSAGTTISLHTYAADCDTICDNCGEKRETTPHTYTNACDKTCNNCGTTRTITHNYTNATCTEAKTCKVCGDTVGGTLKHTYSNACDKSCNRCKATRTVAGHDYKKVVTKATLTKNGVIKNVCQECDYTASKTTTIYKVSSVELSTTTYTYTGGVKKPSVTAKNSMGNKISSAHYTVTYASGRKNVGKYKVTIKFKGNYSGTKTLYFTVNPAKTTVKSLTAAKKSLKVAITKKSTQVTGYQIQYSTSKSFKSAKTKWLTSYKKTSTTLTGLSAKKTYYVRVRTYKKVGGKTYYSGWSTIKYKKTK